MELKQYHAGISDVVIIGAGNLAWHLGHRLSETGFQIRQVYNRSRKPGEQLAGELHTTFTDQPDRIFKDAELYFISVSDDAIEHILNTVQFGSNLVIHTAGSVDISVFSDKTENFGVLYPLQTFTKEKSLDFSHVPVFIEANNKENLDRIRSVAGKLTDRVYALGSNERMYLHLAAVIASNFSNHMYAAAEKIMKKHHLNFNLLEPLLEETLHKAFQLSPEEAQTGPASRGNLQVIQKHMALLGDDPELKELYRVVSEGIMTEKKI
jgi:predicted short-subunit dehydrogenase-like oxidoreductase (DUF2520 family)